MAQTPYPQAAVDVTQAQWSVPAGIPSGAKWDAGVDWITYIAREPHEAAAVTRLANEAAELHREPATKRMPFRLGGYEGWRMGAVRLGFRNPGCLLQLSGPVADALADSLRPFGGQPTRLDVQVTYQPSAPLPSFGQQFIKPRRATSRSRPSSLPRSGLSTGSDGLYLGTVGKRTSERYLRVYDKGVELGTAPEGHLWRMEVEAKGGLAARMWDDLHHSRDRRRWCFDSCAEQWKRSGYCWPLGGSSRNSDGVTIPTKKPAEAERLAAWLTTSVRPAVARMREVYSLAEILDMLGVWDANETADAYEADP